MINKKNYIETTFILSLVLALFLSGCGNHDESQKPQVERAQFAYVVSQGDDVVNQYRLQDDGSLTPLTAPSIATGSLPSSMVMDSTQSYLYVANSNDQTISQFVIKSDGHLETLATPISHGAYTRALVVGPNGNSLYALNLGEDTISHYRIGVNGVLSFEASLPSSDGPMAMTFSPSGKYAYVANIGDSTISQYSVNSQGGLTALTPSVVRTSGCSSGPILANETTAGQSNVYLLSCYHDSIDVFSITSDGTLDPIQTVSTGSSPQGMTISGSQLYVANTLDSSVFAYSIASDGRLNQISSSVLSTAGSLETLTLDVNRKTSYVLDFSESRVLQYHVDSSGNLEPMVTGSVSTGAAPIQVLLKYGKN